MSGWLDFIAWTIFFAFVWYAITEGSDARRKHRVTLANKRAETARYQLRRAEVERETARIRAAASPFAPRPVENALDSAVDLNKGDAVVDGTGRVVARV